MPHLPESFSHKDSIFSCKGNHIGDGAHRYQFHILFIGFVMKSQSQCPAYRIGHSTSCKFFIRISAVLLMGVQHRYSIRYLFRNQVMVRNNDIHSFRSLRNNISGGNTIVHSNKQFTPLFCQLLYRRQIQAISFRFSGRNIKADIRPFPFQKTVQNGCSRYAIYIIIPVDNQGFFFL